MNAYIENENGNIIYDAYNENGTSYMRIVDGCVVGNVSKYENGKLAYRFRCDTDEDCDYFTTPP